MIWLLLGCTENLPYNTLFDAPTTSTVLPADQGAWNNPLGFVGNRRSGSVVPLDLHRNTPFSDQFTAPFLRPRGVALGQNREISAIHADTPASDRITIYALDQHSNALLVSPYITGMLPEPQVIEPTFSTIEFVDADDSGDAPTMEVTALMPGATTTEDWTIRWDARQDGWLVIGSQSGQQEAILSADTPYISDFEEVELSVSGTATDGDYFTFSTDTQVRSIALEGMPIDLLAWDEATLLISVWDNATNTSWITAYDKRNQVEMGRWNAPVDVQLGSMLRIDDQLWIIDQHSEQVLFLTPDLEDISSWTSEGLSTLGPVRDMSVIQTEEYQHLFLATEQRVDIWDINNTQWKQTNPFQSFKGGIDLFSPIVGISSSQRKIELQTTSQWASPEMDHVVVATLFNGSTVMLEGSTGCIATVPGGSSLSLDGTNYGQIQFTDMAPSSNPNMYTSDDGTMLITSNCGGILLDEDWTVQFDGQTGDWLVEGSRSGKQEHRAYSNERYVSDSGAFSFLIMSGGLPATDGDIFTFSTLSNLLELSLVTNTVGNTEALEIPSKPTTFLDYPTADGGWENATPEQFALIPITNTNVVIRLNLETWIVEHVWN